MRHNPEIPRYRHSLFGPIGPRPGGQVSELMTGRKGSHVQLQPESVRTTNRQKYRIMTSPIEKIFIYISLARVISHHPELLIQAE